jgi:aldose 1-epimerase
MSIERAPFGKTRSGEQVEQFILSPRSGNVSAKILTYGGYLSQLCVPDKQGKIGTIVLGFDQLDGYLNDKAYLGALIGRFGNRIARGTFTLDGSEYHLPINNGPNTLHGGTTGFDKAVWLPLPCDSNEKPALELRYASPDGDNGFPGTVEAVVIYTLSSDSLRIDYTATTDKPTPINLTNHAYFNLRGPGSGDVLGHVLTINASQYTPVDDTLIPTGQIAPVKGTSFDFTAATPIGQRIAQIPGGGYDHNYVLDTKGDLSRLAARVEEPTSGRALEVYTTQPGVQLYTGNFLGGSVKGIGGAYQKHGAFCLETQHFPDSPNHPNFPNTILRPGEMYRQTTIYRFSTVGK